MLRVKFVFKLVCLFLSYSSLCDAYMELSIENLVNQKDFFSTALKSDSKIVLEEPYKLYKKRQYLDCYNSADKILSNKEGGSLETDLLSLAITCYVSTPSRKRPEFNLKHTFLIEPEVIKKVFRDLSHRLVREIIKKEVKGGQHPNLVSFLKENVSSICLFDENKTFAQKILKEISQKQDFFKLKLNALPCGFELGETFDVLKEDRETYKIYSKKGLKAIQNRPQVRFSYIKLKIGKREYSKFRRLNKKKSLEYILKLSQAPGYVMNRISKNLFYRGKYKLLIEFLKNSKIPPETMSYIVKSKAALGDYEGVLSVTTDLIHKQDGWSEEILLTRGGVFLRQKKYEEAEKNFELMLKNAKDLRLSALYWRWVSLIELNEKKAAKKVSKELLKNYPFTYYGLIVAHHYKGPKFFEKYSGKYINYSEKFKTISDTDVERFKTYYRLGWKSAFYDLYQKVEEELSPKEKAAFALVFYNFGEVRHTIRILNNEWDNDSSLRAEPFISSSFTFMYSDSILKEADKNKNLGPEIVRAIIRQESAFQEKAKSGSGAKGLMQLMNPTARELARQLRVKRFNVNRSLYDASINIKLGSKYMDRLINANKGYLPYAFASYNAGPGKMNRWSSKRDSIYSLKKGLDHRLEKNVSEFWIEELPWSETRFYTKALLRNMGIYLAISGQKESFNCNPFWTCSPQTQD